MTTKQLFNFIVILLCGFLSIFCLFFSLDPYDKLWLLPVTYLIVYLVFWRLKSNKKIFSSTGDLLFKFSVTIRYIVIPTIIILNGSVNYGVGSNVGNGKYDYAITYMIYELVFISIVYQLLKRPSKINLGLETKISDRNNIIIYQLMVIVGMALLVLPEIRNRYTFFASSIMRTSREIVSSYVQSYNLLFYVVNYAKIAIPIVVIVICSKLYSKNPRKRYVVLSIVGSIIPNFFYIATSRNSIFLPMLASFFTMLIVFDKHRKIIFSIYGSGIIFIIGMMTWFKALLGSTSVTQDWLTNYLSIYFLGPKEYVIGLSAIETYASDITVITLINDIIGNIPGLSGFADLLNRTNQYYNWTYYGGSHIGLGGGYIVPSSIQGAFHFGYILGPIMTCISLYTIRWSERLIERNSTNISTVYIANYAMSAAALYYANSVSSLLNLLFFIIIPMLIINLLQRLLIKKNAKYKYNHNNEML